MSGRLAGKVALITGGSRGIGAAIARAFADEGCSLVLAARREPEEAPPGEFRAADVSAEGDVRALYDFVRERHGRLDLLVNNAAVIGYGPIDELAVEDWDDVMAVNLRGAFLCTREAMRMMKPQGGGRIINIGSTSARRVREGTAAYCVSKFGLWPDAGHGAGGPAARDHVRLHPARQRADGAPRERARPRADDPHGGRGGDRADDGRAAAGRGDARGPRASPRPALLGEGLKRRRAYAGSRNFSIVSRSFAWPWYFTR